MAKRKISVKHQGVIMGSIKRAAIFGSFARGEEYSPETKRSIFNRIKLKYDLQDTLNIKVDVVTENALSPLIKDSNKRKE